MNQEKNKSRGQTSSHQHHKAPSQLNRKKKKSHRDPPGPFDHPVSLFFGPLKMLGKEKLRC
jgi:hypothetical protein